MAFADDILALGARVSEFRAHINGEDQTKNALIMPFLTAMGYDVFNPLHVVPEFTADFAVQANRTKPEKVDYALLGDQHQPVMFVEAKPLGTKLENHDPQLSRYFNAVPSVRFGVITDGCVYRFFTDLDAPNVMDSRPFYQFDLQRCRDEDIDILQRFHRSMFDGDKLRLFAEDIRYRAAFRKDLITLIQAPTPEFVRLMLGPHFDGRLTEKVLERFTPLVQQAFISAIGEMISIGAPRVVDLPAASEPVTPPPAADDGKAKIVTTAEELAFYESAKAILADRGINPADVLFRDTTAYFNISYLKPTKWFFRGCFDAKRKHVLSLVPVERARELVPGADVDAPNAGMGVSRIYEIDPAKLAALLWESFQLKDSLKEAAATTVEGRPDVGAVLGSVAT